MFKNFRKTAVLFSAALLAGGIFQFACATQEILANRYLQYGMPRLIAFTFQKNLNQAGQWALILLLTISLLHATFSLVLKIFHRTLSEKIPSNFLSPERAGGNIFFISTFLGLLICAGWATNHYWLPEKLHPLSLAGDFGVFISALFLAWFSSKDFLVKIGRFLLAAGALFLVLLLGLNAGVYADMRLNPPKGPNVILISIDTLRYDALGINSCKIKDISPNIDQFAQESINFKSCIAQAPWTLPSHVTMLTSLYPETHKVTDEGKKIPRSIMTLAELLRNQNYFTDAITDGGNLDPVYGFSQGFMSYDFKCDYFKKKFPELKRILRRNKQKKFFLFFHTYELHAPFIHTNYLDLLLKQGHINKKQKDSLKNFVLLERPDLGTMKEKMISLGMFDKDACQLLYWGGINFVDQYFGMLIAYLKELNLLDDSVIVFTSDHGEVFGEHDKRKFYHFHWAGLFQENIKVPLFIHIPDASTEKGRENPAPVGLVDIMPTILTYLKIPSPQRMAGIDLLENPKPTSLLKDKRSIFSSVEPKMKTIIEGNLKYIENPKNPSEFIGPKNAGLYDLDSDPEEQNNLAGQFPEECERLNRELEKFTYWAENFLDVKPEKAKLKEEQKKQLRALGYLQ